MSATALLMRQLVELQEKPSDGFAVQGIVEENILKWRVVVFGPAETPYEGGTFVAELIFPPDFPQHPPRMRFLSRILHPNIYTDGFVCVSTLHEPGRGRPSEDYMRWQKVHTVESIVISVQSLLAEPNFKSPANLGASFMFHGNPERYNELVRQCVKWSNEFFEQDSGGMF